MESLLKHESEAKAFIAAPTLEMAAKAMAEETDRVLVGKQIGAYKITSLLGTGGMGEVYRAEDTRLGRTVAVKILPTELAPDQDRMRRFVREAKAASALKHPNVATHLRNRKIRRVSTSLPWSMWRGKPWPTRSAAARSR